MANHEGISGEVNKDLRTGALELIKIYFNHSRTRQHHYDC
jgi:hypothetical protein